MSDQDTAFPLTAPQLAGHYKEVASFQKRRALLARYMSRGLVVALAASLFANLGLAWAIAAMLPLARLVPVYLLIRPDGTIDTSVSLSTLPRTQNEAVLRAALWQYVTLREGYTYHTARYRYDIVSAMSDPRARAIYQDWYNYPHPHSPQVTVGKNGYITVAPISVALIGRNVAQVRFERQVTMGTDAPTTTTWTATIQYEQVETLPTSARLTNPGGVVVTSYQAEEDTAP